MSTSERIILEKPEWRNSFIVAWADRTDDADDADNADALVERDTADTCDQVNGQLGDDQSAADELATE